MPVPNEERNEYFNKESSVYDIVRDNMMDPERLHELLSIIIEILPIYRNIAIVYHDE